MTPEQIAAELVAAGFARLAPVGQTRCLTTIELRAIPDNWGRLYVKPNGEIRYGYTLNSSKPVSPGFRARIVGEDQSLKEVQ